MNPAPPHPGQNLQQQPAVTYKLVNAKSKFTYLFCCHCNYSALCVHRFSFGLDIFLFGLWVIVGLGNIGNYGSYSWLYTLLVAVFLIQVVLGIRHLYKFNTFVKQGILKQKTTMYLRVRLFMTIYIVVVGILIGLVYLFVLKQYLIDKGYYNRNTGKRITEEEGQIVAVYACVTTIVPLIFNVIVLYSYKKSFDDSIEALVGQPGAVNPDGSQLPLQTFDKQQPAPIQQNNYQYGNPIPPQGPVYHGGAPTMIGGPHAVPYYQQGQIAPLPPGFGQPQVTPVSGPHPSQAKYNGF